MRIALTTRASHCPARRSPNSVSRRPLSLSQRDSDSSSSFACVLMTDRCSSPSQLQENATPKRPSLSLTTAASSKPGIPFDVFAHRLAEPIPNVTPGAPDGHDRERIGEASRPSPTTAHNRTVPNATALPDNDAATATSHQPQPQPNQSRAQPHPHQQPFTSCTARGTFGAVWQSSQFKISSFSNPHYSL